MGRGGYMLTCGLHGIMDDKRCDIQYPVFLLAIALTGLTWSFAWYRTGFYALCGVEQQADGGDGRQEGRQDISSSGLWGGHGANEPDGAYRHAEGGEDSHRGHGYHGGGHRDGAYADEDRSVKVRSAVYTVHTGSWGGWLTRLVTFLAALLGASLPLTGYYLWIRRLLRKRKSAGQPADVRPVAARPSSTP